jgi:tetratricopeptide (TPR) repeat protein
MRFTIIVLLCWLCCGAAAVPHSEKDTKDPDKLAALGTACLKKGDIAGAERYYDLCYHQKRITTSMICLAGDIALAKNDEQQADYHYGRAIYFDPRDPLGYWHYADMHKKKEPALAVAKLKQLRLYRDDCRVEHKIAEVWYAGNKVKEAAAAYDSIPIDSLNRDELVSYAMSTYLLQAYQKSADIALHGRSVSPRDLVFNRLVMYNYTDLKLYDKALEASVELFEHSERKAEADSVADREKKTFTYLDYIYYGYVLNGNGRYEEGIAQFNHALELNGDRTDVILAISKAYENVGDYPKAVEHYKLYMEKLPEEERTAYVVYELGRLYYAQGTSTQESKELTTEKRDALKLADQTFEEVDRMRPDSYLGVYWRARTNVALDPDTKRGLAKPYYQKVIEMTEKTGGSQLTEAYKYMAYYYYVKKDQQNTLKYADKILDIDPTDSYALRLSTAF